MHVWGFYSSPGLLWSLDQNCLYTWASRLMASGEQQAGELMLSGESGRSLLEGCCSITLIFSMHWMESGPEPSAAPGADEASFFFLLFHLHSHQCYPFPNYFSSLPVSLSALLGTLALSSPCHPSSVSSFFLSLFSGATKPFCKFLLFFISFYCSLFLPQCLSCLPHDGVQPCSSGTVLRQTIFLPSSCPQVLPEFHPDFQLHL